MTTAQIIIFLVFSLITYGTNFTLYFKTDRENDTIFILNFVSFSFILLVAILTTTTMNTLKSRCPEYVKIENVYKLK